MGVQVRGNADTSLIVCSHLPGEGHFESDCFRVVPALCEDDYSYWAALDAAWSTDATICNVEHDMEVSDAHIAALLDCPHPLCSWSYHCHWATTGLPRDVIAAGFGDRHSDGPSVGMSFLAGGEEWAKWSAIGLVKITAEARLSPLRREPWSRVELAVADATGHRRWHMHGNGSAPGDFSGHVAHHHW